MSNRILTKLVSCVALALLASHAYAYEFVPSDTEFAAWPSYCKARYITTNIGQEQKWSTTFTQAEVEASKRAVGELTFTYVHHYCAGLVWLERARYEADAFQKKYKLQNAYEEVTFTYPRIPTGSPLYSSMLITLGRIEKERNNLDLAISYTERAITSNPENAQGYIALAILYRDQKKLTDAIATLERGNIATENASADIHYNLGIMELEAGNTDAALKQAHKAYELGYPLPGLRNKLVALNKWED